MLYYTETHDGFNAIRIFAEVMERQERKKKKDFAVSDVGFVLLFCLV